MPEFDRERAQMAAGRIFDRHGIRAEWCQLMGRPGWPELARGHWYRVVDFDTANDVVTLETQEAESEIPYSALKASRDIPEKATVLIRSTLASPSPGIPETTHQAVCPKGHEMGGAHPKKDLPLSCADCGGREFEWEFESSGGAS